MVEGSLRVMRPDDIVKQPNAMFCERVCSHPGLQDRTCLMGMGFADAAKLLDSFRLGSIFLLLFLPCRFLVSILILVASKVQSGFLKDFIFRLFADCCSRFVTASDRTHRSIAKGQRACS